MKNVDRIDIKKKWPIPAWVKMVLLLAVVLGIWGRNCWLKSKDAYIEISDIEVLEATRVSADVAFRVENKADVSLKKSFLIQIYNQQDEQVASKISQIELPPKSNRRYLKVMQKFNIPLMNGMEDIKDITVEVYR